MDLFIWGQGRSAGIIMKALKAKSGNGEPLLKFNQSYALEVSLSGGCRKVVGYSYTLHVGWADPGQQQGT